MCMVLKTMTRLTHGACLSASRPASSSFRLHLGCPRRRAAARLTQRSTAAGAPLSSPARPPRLAPFSSPAQPLALASPVCRSPRPRGTAAYARFALSWEAATLSWSAEDPRWAIAAPSWLSTPRAGRLMHSAGSLRHRVGPMRHPSGGHAPASSMFDRVWDEKTNRFPFSLCSLYRVFWSLRRCLRGHLTVNSNRDDANVIRERKIERGDK